MKHFYLLILLLSVQSFFAQESKITTDWDEAKQMATDLNKDILIVMTGNEWCVTSRDMRKRVLESDDFMSYSNAEVITFLIDIPNEGCEGDVEEIRNYQKFSDMYETDAFPAMVLVNNEGDKIKTIDGKLYKRKNVMQQLVATPN